MNASGEYHKPDWSSLPLSNDYALEVIKQGVILDEVSLTGREYFLIGRQLDRVHIPAEHPSISRVHAAFNFHRDGSLMLIDLGSAQGTCLNKKLLQKNSFTKINVGDVIKFGQSTRLYVVKGPEDSAPIEYNSSNLEMLRRQSEERELITRRERERREEQLAVTWGISMDDTYDDPVEETVVHDDHKPFASDKDDRKRSFLPEYLRRDENYDRKYGDRYEAPINDDEAKSKKDLEILDKIRKKERKIQNMEEENRRIYMKEQSQDEGLTDGQLAAVARNDKSIEQLTAEIDNMIGEIRGKYDNDGNGYKNPNKRQKLHDIEDDSDCLDTTDQTADATTNWRLRKKMNRAGVILGVSSHSNMDKRHVSMNRQRDALSFKEIKSILESATSKLAEVQKEIQFRVATAQRLQLKLVKDAVNESCTVDEIDKVVSQDQIKESQQRLKVLRMEEIQLDETLKQYSKLLEVATPAFATLSYKEDAPDVFDANQDNDNEKVHNSAVNEPLQQSDQNKSIILDRSNDETNQKIELDVSSRIVERDTQLHMERTDDQVQGGMSAVGVKMKSEADTESTGNKKVFGPRKLSKGVSLSLPETKASMDVLESGEYIWVPPKQQTGDGRTSLNAKFGY